jgi:hypothetical protein
MAKQQIDHGFDCIDDSILGDYAIDDFLNRVYPKVYYAIRERQGFISKGLLGDRFNWLDFKTTFEYAFGSLEKPSYSMEQLLEYAQRKFNMSLNDLIEANKQSWVRRQNYEQKGQVVNFNNVPRPQELPY